MRKIITILLSFAMIGTGLVLSGCRTPRLGEGYRDGVPEAQLRASGGDMQVAWGDSAEGWQGMESSMVSDAAMKAAGNEKRWEGVAVYFAYDRATIGASERSKVETLADFLTATPSYYVIIEGHCDERGSDEYNRALGERRALAVKEYLLSLGIADSRIQTLSYGEERPAIPDAVNAQQHAQNRRCEFIIGRE
ncbi:MAG: OmpA family protein [Lentisphaeria bacterium]